MSSPQFLPVGFMRHITAVFRKFGFYAPPTPEVIAAFLTIVHKASKLYDVGIVAWALMSSHPHLAICDNDPEREPHWTGRSAQSLFVQYVHSKFAMWLNHYWDSSGNIFDVDVLTQQIPILDVTTEIELVSYVENNMAKAGILDPHDELEGAVSRRDYLFEPIEIDRPTGWFQKRTWDDKASIQLVVPPAARAEGHTRETWFAKTKVAVAEGKMHALEEVLLSGKPLLFPEDVQNRVKPTDRKSKVSHSRIPCTGATKLIKARFLQLRREYFLPRYREALALVKAGRKDVVFPWGTDKMVNVYGYEMDRRPG